MKRREFIAAAASSMILPLTVNGLGVKSFNENSSLVKSIIKTNAAVSDRILVIIYLNGGNDGLNTVIPLDQYSKYYNLRSNIAIPESNVLKLSGNLKTGLHPSMTGMRDMYNDGKLAIVHSVSYPNPNQSHVRSTDILMTGVSADKYSETGWAARYLENRFPGFPANYPNAQMSDPLAIQIGYVDTTTLKGSVQPMNVSFEDPVKFYQMMGQLGSVSSEGLPCCDAGELIQFIKQQQVLSIGYSSRIKQAADTGKTLATYPTASATNDLSEQLKIVAKLIHGGLQSKIYFVEMGGFDTHAGQVGTTPLEGMHAVLLKKMSDAIAAFQNDLKLQGTEDKVIGMTFSDFGRRATSNTSKGTDHGIAAPMFVFGTNIKRQGVGTNPDLTSDMEPPTTTSGNKNQDIKMQIDFRRIYTDILTDWFGVTTATTNAVMFGNHKTTSIFSNVIESTGSGSWPDRGIWTAGSMPATSDYVRIKAGHIVDVGQDLTVRNIHVEKGGELRLLGNYNIVTTG
ncbi:DUF1501 domain-containing protein [Dyadobacter sandarakinus]|uniref:DUF1501 domain-containing protein n=1 Tax=Dyadobacter sandarakinus TaxID=2747268 RepID=A0ABX7IBT6_9BACT|nr:DUF1501 domain-containing protein [Dyadobacter sandarakinus]QRR03390.1 DUF1501 domain-containing protein [Dyadobacter sandarakinus]